MQPIRTHRLDLPEPDAASASHCERVRAHIRDAIIASECSISFAEFMQHAMYATGLGYYAAGATKFGGNGDFVTAPEITPLFGRVLARQSAFVLDQLKGADVFELGAGTGALAISILKKLDELQALPKRYLILEVSADLQERQESRLKNEAPDLLGRVCWVEQMPSRFSGVIVANEVADAFPVERFLIRDGAVLQARVTVDEGEFAWCYGEAPMLLEDAVRKLESELGRRFDEGYTSEISLGIHHWVCALAKSIVAGFVFLVDYGVSRADYYARERNEGWLRCHFRHRAHNNPLLYPGIQDISCWVDFTAVAEAASDAGLTVAGYVTQANLLMAGGLSDELADFESLSVAEQVVLSGRIKLLTLPGEMGENFKCMGLSCGNVITPPGFTEFDRRHLL